MLRLISRNAITWNDKEKLLCDFYSSFSPLSQSYETLIVESRYVYMFHILSLLELLNWKTYINVWIDEHNNTFDLNLNLCFRYFITELWDLDPHNKFKALYQCYLLALLRIFKRLVWIDIIKITGFKQQKQVKGPCPYFRDISHLKVCV